MAARLGRRAQIGRGRIRHLGGRLKVLVGKPGLDGHSNGAEQNRRARPRRWYGSGVRRYSPHHRADVIAARDEGVHVVGLSILSGSHVPLVLDVLDRMRAAGIGDIPVIIGGIIPPEDADRLLQGRRRPRLHAQGLSAQRHHGGYCEGGGYWVRARRREGGGEMNYVKLAD